MRDLGRWLGELEVAGRYDQTVRLLRDLFRATTPEEVARVVYLLRGRVGPAHAAPDLGIDEGLLVSALSRASGTDRAAVARLLRERSDPGLVAEELLPQAAGDLSVGGAYRVLEEVASSAGAGSEARKAGLVSDLLRQTGGLGARYLTRILLGRLRLGVGDAAIVDGLAAAAGEPQLRPEVERAYSLCADLGYVAGVALADPVALANLGPQPGKPVLPAMAERLRSPEEAIQQFGHVEAEPKYDGLRLQLHKDGETVRFFTRNLAEVTPMFPDLARAAREQVRANRAIVDGEALAYDPDSGELLPFQMTARRRRTSGVAEMEERFPLKYFAFDLMLVDGEDLTREPLRERRRRLDEVVVHSAADPIQVTQAIETDSPAELEQFFEATAARGLEGIVVKVPGSPYPAGERSFAWTKIKRSYRSELSDTVDVVVVGYTIGKGKRSRVGIGSILAAVYDPAGNRYRTLTKIGTGLSDAGWFELRQRLDAIRAQTRPAQVDSLSRPDVWVELRYVVEALADGITRSRLYTAGKVGDRAGYALRFPRLVRVRWDKNPEDATTEAEIVALHKSQGRRDRETAA